MTRKTVIIECRNPRSREERSLYGLTETEGGISYIFINAKKNRTGAELINTLFHEFGHAAVGLYKTRLTAKREETFARLVGDLVTDTFRRM